MRELGRNASRVHKFKSVNNPRSYRLVWPRSPFGLSGRGGGFLGCYPVLMADWFKFHNDSLDSAGMQYCISEQPMVVGVWLLILCEASKNRACRFAWDNSDFRLLGHARKLNTTAGIFNQCLNLLQHCNYIEIKDGHLTISGWERIQSDYARGLDKGYYKNTRKKLASVSEVSTTRGEEKRGEEKRGDKNMEVEAHLSRCLLNPTWEQCLKWLKASNSNGSDYNEVELRAAFLSFEACGWMWGKNPVTDYRAAIERRIQDDRNREIARNGGKPIVAKKSIVEQDVDRLCREADKICNEVERLYDNH